MPGAAGEVQAVSGPTAFEDGNPNLDAAIAGDPTSSH
jgi:hypothetical protein